MSNWYEVFDNEEVQWHARRQATRLTMAAAAAVLITFCIAVLALDGWLALPIAGGLLVTTWLGAVYGISRRLRRLRRVVWCIKLSEERVVGYDYTRHKAVMAWAKIQRAELTRDGLLLVGEGACTFHIPHLFPDFAVLSHRVVYYAEQHGVPVFLDGRPWQDLDVYRVFPFLADAAPKAGAGDS